MWDPQTGDLTREKNKKKSKEGGLQPKKKSSKFHCKDRSLWGKDLEKIFQKLIV